MHSFWNCRSVCISCVIALLLCGANVDVRAEYLPFSYRNNQVRVVADRSVSGETSAIVVRVKAPESIGFNIFEAQNPARIVVDFRGSRTTRSRNFTFHDSEVLNSIRCGVHPGFMRLVLEFKTRNTPPYSYSKDGDWFLLTVTEIAEEKHRPLENVDMSSVRKMEERTLLDDTSLRIYGWNKINQDLKSDSSDEQTLTDHLEIRPEIEFESSSQLKTVLSAESNIFTDFETESGQDSEIRLFDAYLNYNSDWYNIRLGNQIVSWGKSDEISALDVVNPEDFRDGFVRPRAERKIPIPMVNAEFMDDYQRVQLLYMPVFQRSRLDLSGSEWALFGNENHQQNFLDHQPGDGEYGTRYLLTFDSFDLGFSYLSSFSDLPVFAGNPLPVGAPPISRDIDRGTLIALASQQGQIIDLEHPRQDVFGVEYETVYESIGIRGDLSYKTPENFVTNTLERYDSDTIQWSTGFDWLSSNDLYINLQYSQTYIRDFTSSILYARELQHGIYAEFYKELWYNKLRTGLKLLYGFPLTQQYYNPYIRLNSWDKITFEIGADIIEGESVSPLGFYNTNDQIYLITRFYF